MFGTDQARDLETNLGREGFLRICAEDLRNRHISLLGSAGEKENRDIESYVWFSAQSRRIYFKERNEGKPNLNENKTTKSPVESEPEKPITEQLSTAKFMATGKVLSQTPSIDLTIDAKTWLGTSSSARVEQKVTAPQHDAVVDVSEKD